MAQLTDKLDAEQLRKHQAALQADNVQLKFKLALPLLVGTLEAEFDVKKWTQQKFEQYKVEVVELIKNVAVIAGV